MYHKTLADGFFLFSILAIFSAMVGWAIDDPLDLASTQWMLIAIVMLLMAIYVKMNADDDEKILQARSKKVKVTKAKAVKHVSFRLTK